MEDFEAAAEGEVAPSGRTPEGRPTVWLKLEWNPSGMPIDYFSCVETGQTVWTRPLEPDRVIELRDLEAQLDNFAEKVKALEQLTAQCLGASAAFPEPGGAFLADPLASTVEPFPSALEGGASSSSSWSHLQTLPEAASVLSAGLGRRPEEEEDGPAQETRFGGRESVQSAEGSAFFSTSAAAATTFHPHRPSTRQEEAATRPHRRPPGRMPWSTFREASLVLMVVWGVGLLWCFIRIFLDIDRPTWHRPDAELLGALGPAVEAGLELVFAGPWPHAHFQPEGGLACHDSLGAVLVAERYGVYELPLRNRSLGAPRAALEACLAQDPDFQSRGLRGVAMRCPAGMGEPACDAVLLGVHGAGALRCPLSEGALGEPAARLAARSGSWRSLGSGDVGGLWALREAGDALVWLQPQLGSEVELAPRLELPLGVLGGARWAQALPAGVVLGLAPGGKLQAWAPRCDVGHGREEPALLWALDLPKDVEWAGLCVTGAGAAYLASGPSQRGHQEAGVWRVDLPGELRGRRHVCR